MNRGHALALGVEGDFAHPGPFPPDGAVPDPGLFGEHKERPFRGIPLQLPRAVASQERGIVAQGGAPYQAEQGRVGSRVDGAIPTPQVPGGIVADARDVQHAPARNEFPNGHLVPGQRPRLVRADDAGTTQGLHGGEAADDGSAPDRPLDADGERAGYDGRESLRDGGDSETDPPNDHLQHWMPAGDPNADDAGRHGETP